MNIVAVDNEQFALMDLQMAIEEALPGSKLSCFDTPSKVLAYAKGNQIDVAFLDIEMGGMNGLMLAKQLKDIYGKTNIVFVTGYSQYAVDAFALHASGYLLKPVTSKAVFGVIEYLRHPIKAVPTKRIKVQTFGNFELFVDGKPVTFKRTKAKEVFAYLVSKYGARCNNNEIIAMIWDRKEDNSSLKSMFRSLVADLINTFNSVGIRDVIIKQRGSLSISVSKVSCDLYDFCTGVEVNNYMGEFMAQYSWAEFKNAYLERMSR